MASNNTLGLIFSNMHDDNLREITGHRTMGSVPFGARYRLIDLALSNFINSDVTNIGVIARTNYQSLLDHLGSGKDWDLARKHGGLTILPPYGHSGYGVYSGRVEALYSVLDYVEQNKAKYVVLSDCDCVCSIDFESVLEQHVERDAELTMIYTDLPNRPLPAGSLYPVFDADGRMVELRTQPRGLHGEGAIGMNMYIVNREVLLEIVRDLQARSLFSFDRDFLQANLSRLRMFGYHFTGYTGFIADRVSYFAANMDNLRPVVRRELYSSRRPVYTRILDEAPVIYGLGSSVKNSFIADGCFIDGAVENCVIFRGVHIGKGCRISNCILMQGARIAEDTTLSYVILDKDVTVGASRSLQGYHTYPVYIAKGSRV